MWKGTRPWHKECASVQRAEASHVDFCVQTHLFPTLLEKNHTRKAEETWQLSLPGLVFFLFSFLVKKKDTSVNPLICKYHKNSALRGYVYKESFSFRDINGNIY